MVIPKSLSKCHSSLTPSINEESSNLQLDGIDDDPMQQLIGCSVSYRIAAAPQQGRKVFTLQTLPAIVEDDRYAQVAKEAGFSLQAGVAAQASERDKLERLCRYISRPAVSEKRLSLTLAGNIRYQLKTAYSDGTTHVAVLTHPCATRHSYVHELHI
jgi:hypothetical protein